MAQKFSKREAIKFGWQIMKENIGFFIGLLIVEELVSIVPSYISNLLERKSPLFAFVVGMIGFVLGMIVSLGLIKISLNFCDSIKNKIRDVFSQYKLFFNYLFASILYALTVLPGLILLIIPGIYLATRLQFYGYFIVDKKSGIIESLKRSWMITQGNVWNLFLFGLLLGLISLLGFLFLIIGLFAAIPTAMVARAFVYRKLLANVGELR